MCILMLYVPVGLMTFSCSLSTLLSLWVYIGEKGYWCENTILIHLGQSQDN